MPDLYRVGNHQPRNLYRGDEYIGVMFDPADTALIARVLNEWAGSAPIDRVYPPVFRDESGDDWYLRDDGTYRLRDARETRTLDDIKANYGEWRGHAG
jgi:hypothetical protein